MELEIAVKSGGTEFSRTATAEQVKGVTVQPLQRRRLAGSTIYPMK